MYTMETLVLPAQDQFSHAQNQRLAGVEYYPQRKYERQWQNSTVGASMHQERNTTTHSSENGFCSPPDKLVEHENGCSFSSVLPNEKSSSPASCPILPSCMSSSTVHEGYATLPARGWHSMPCRLPDECNALSIQAKDQGFICQRLLRPSKHENRRNLRSDIKNRTPCHSAMNKKRTGCDWKPVETGPQNCRAVTIPKQRNPERKSPSVSYEMNVSYEVSSISPPASPTENWAGPAYSNSPPPSSLPLPKFSMRQMRSASLELPSENCEFSEALSTEALRASSRSVPTSPSRTPPVVVQGFATDVASATKNLKRILHLDLGD